jgi:succinoglycan biosynthesis transport protein ExoP
MSMQISGELGHLRQLPQSEMDSEAVKSPMLIFSIIRRRKLSILAMTLLMSGAVAYGATYLRPSFVASTSVLMQQRNPSIGDVTIAPGLTGTDSVAIRTQADILKSEDLARSVVQGMHLVDLPEFAPAPANAIIAKLRGLIEHPGAAVEPTAAELEELAVQKLLSMVTIVNDGRSYVIDIKAKVTAGDGQTREHAAALSARLANAYAAAYVSFTGDMKSQSIKHANSFFDERIEGLKAKMRVAQHAVQTYRAENNLVEDSAASGNGRSVTLVGQQLAQLNSDLIAATSDRAKKEAALEQIMLARNGTGDLQSVPEVVSSPLIQRLREQQADLGGREAALAMTRGSGNSELIAVRASQRDVSNQIAAETAKIAASLRSAVAAARGREVTLRSNLAQMQGQVGVQGQTEVKLHELQNEADIAGLLYATYLKRYEETANQINLQDPDATVVSRAGVPLGPLPPSRQQIIVVGVVLSAFLSTLFAIVRERMRVGFRTSEQLEASVGIETIGFLPKVRNMRHALEFGNRHSVFSEAIFSTRALLRLNVKLGSSVVMVTSALPQEGKTFFASSLARNAALAGERVLLIDCDLRRPAVAKNITTSNAQEEGHVTIHRDTVSPLDVITLRRGTNSPQDLFASSRMGDLVGKLRKRYDLIVLDTPPVLAVSDARILAALADVTILVVRWQSTPRNLVNNAIVALRNSGAKIAGTVINQVKLNDLDGPDIAKGYYYRDQKAS